MTQYDRLGGFLYDRIIKGSQDGYFSTYAVKLSYSYDKKEWHDSIEIFEISPCDGGIIWFNDWYEGQPFIKLIGVMNIDTVFNLGFYKDLYCEFMEACHE